jgi:tRNA pseudouridine55 synthase
VTPTARGQRGQSLDGVLLLDKPLGLTSQSAVTRVKRLLGASKAGHTGTLDPMATGLLPIALGQATKFSHGLLEAEKSYRATVRLGVKTTTGDLEGEVVSRSIVECDAEAVNDALSRFRGEITQVPPMYSALKHKGKPLYSYARQGAEIERAPRRVIISRLELERFASPDMCIEVTCSKGTYIRVLAEDIGGALGCGATLAALTRTRVGEFDIDRAVALEALEALRSEERLRLLHPVDSLVADLPEIRLDGEAARRLGCGQQVRCQSVPGAPGVVLRVYGPAQTFLGVASVTHDGALVPRRLVSTPTPA